MAQFASDSFTGTATTALPSYDADWVSRSGTLQISSGGDKATSNGSSHAYYTGGTPASADYSVSADIDLGALTGYGGGLTVRNATGSDTKYYARAVYNSGTGAHQLYRVVNGSFSAIAGTGSNYTPSGAKAALLQAITNGSQVDIEWWFDGTQQLTYSDTNANRIVAAGYPGISCFGGSINSNTWDNFSADDIVGSVEISPSAGAITLAGYAPIVTNSTPTSVTVDVGIGALAIAGLAPTLKVTQSTTTGVGALTLEGYGPTVYTQLATAPGVGALTLTGYAPVVRVTQLAAPAPGALTIAGLAPTVVASLSTTPGTGALTLTGYESVVYTQVDVAVGAGALTITGYGPTVFETSASPVISTESGVLEFIGYSPEVSNSGETVTKGGAARGKRKKRRKLIDYSEQPITQIIHNLESDRKLSQGVIENTRQVIKPVEAPILEDVGPLKETLQSLLKEKQTVKTVTQQIADLTTKPVEEPVKEVVEYATKDDVQALNVKLDLILKRLDNLSNDMEIIAALAAS